MNYLFANEYHNVANLPISLPVLTHVDVDTKTLFVKYCDLLDETEGSGVSTNISHGRVGQIMMSRRSRISTKPSNNGKGWTQDTETEQVLAETRVTKIDYDVVPQEKDHFVWPFDPRPSWCWPQRSHWCCYLSYTTWCSKWRSTW